MNFNTAVFLFLFLPAFLLAYFIARPRWRGWLGLVASLLFYSWGQIQYVPLIAAIAAFNYGLGLRIASVPADALQMRRRWLNLGVAVNAAVLVGFKLLVTYGTQLLGPLAGALPESAVNTIGSMVFPLGLSYISFQAISYLIDVAGGAVQAERRFVTFCLYIFLFPKLLAGPIVRYQSIAEQLVRPAPSRDLIADGIRGFIQGLAKKVLIADVLARLVTAVFDQPSPMVAPGIAWLALIAYALQIYYDFSGYSDMAIGLGMMMGFRFLENFNYPYFAQSIGDFWRRWHISLSGWFRDYVFFPLERRRRRKIGQQVNILIVFLLTGLWHGITITFVLWGLLHAAFLILESLFLGRLLPKIFRPARHLYAISAILLTWLLFRSPSPAFALAYLGRLLGNTEGLALLPFTQTSPLPFIEPSIWLAFGAGIFFSFPMSPHLGEQIQTQMSKQRVSVRLSAVALRDALLLILLVASVGAMASTKFLPGIYGGF